MPNPVARSKKDPALRNQWGIIGILLAMLAFFGYYILMGLGLAYGKRQILAPVLAGWLPGLVFTALGLGLLRRIR